MTKNSLQDYHKNQLTKPLTHNTAETNQSLKKSLYSYCERLLRDPSKEKCIYDSKGIDHCIKLSAYIRGQLVQGEINFFIKISNT